IRQAWREGRPVPLSQYDGSNGKTAFPRQDKGIMALVGIAKVDAGPAQDAAYNKLFGIGKDGTPITPDPGAKARKEAEKLGAILGRLALAEVIEITGDFSTDLDLFVPGVKDLAKSARKDV